MDNKTKVSKHTQVSKLPTQSTLKSSIPSLDDKLQTSRDTEEHTSSSSIKPKVQLTWRVCVKMRKKKKQQKTIRSIYYIYIFIDNKN